MKTLFIAIVSSVVIGLGMLSFFIIIQNYNSDTHSKLIGAVSYFPPQFIDITTEPEIISIGETFQIYATIYNPNIWPLTFYDGCESPLSISFDKNVQIQNVIECNAVSNEIINSNETVRVHGPGTGTIYNVTTIGITNATITFSFQSQGKNFNITTSKQITIGPPLAPPTQLASQLRLAKMYVNPKDHSVGLRLDCKKPIGLQMKSIDESVDVKKAIDLAYTSQEFVSKVNQYGTLTYNNFFNDWITGDPCNTIWKGVEVVFSTTDTNGFTRNVQISEDIDLTKVLNVTDYQSGFGK